MNALAICGVICAALLFLVTYYRGYGRGFSDCRKCEGKALPKFIAPPPPKKRKLLYAEPGVQSVWNFTELTEPKPTKKSRKVKKFAKTVADFDTPATNAKK